MKQVTVLGAAGRLGDHAAAAFLDAGWTVKGVARGAKAAGLRHGVEAIEADAFDRRSLIRACEGSDVVFNGLNPLYPEWHEKVMPMARNVVAALKATGAAHVFPGNVYNYGREIPALAGPDTPQYGSTRKGALRIGMEQLFAEAASRDGIQTIILRAGDFYGGTARGSWFDLVITAKLAKGVFTYPGPTDLAHAWAYLPDLSRAFVALAEKREALGRFERFTFPGHTMTGAELKAHCETVVGRQLKTAGVPWAVMRAGGLVYPMWREVAEMSYLWHRPHALSGDKLAAAIGTVEITPVAEAVRQAITDLGIVKETAALAA